MAGEFRITGGWDTQQQRLATTAISAKQLRFAQSLAVNTTARRIRAAEETVMRQRIDQPTPWTARSLSWTRASRDGAEASVWFKDRAHGMRIDQGHPAGEYLLPQVHGGTRKTKGFERALAGRGVIPSGAYAVPASGITLDKYGNVSAGTLTKIMSGLGIFSEVRSKANATGSRRSKKKGNATRYWFGAVNGQDGIWERARDGLKPLFTIKTTPPRYRSRFPFHQVGENVANAHFEKDMEWAIAAAVSPARVGSFSPVSFR